MEFSVDFAVYEKGRKAPQWTINSDQNGEMTLAELLQFTKSSLILIAHEALQEEQARGFDKKPVVVVDGRVNKPVIEVSPLGKIEFIARADALGVVLEIYNGILSRSPVDTGRYKSSHYVFLNGQQVATDLSSLTSWVNRGPELRDTDIIRFVNIQPYARKLERLGVTKARTSARTSKSRDKRNPGGRVLVPNGAYFLTMRSIARKYKYNSRIKFGFIPGSSLGLSAVFKTGSVKRKKPSRTYLYPTISLTVKAEGIK